jgi:hypothetical protein
MAEEDLLTTAVSVEGKTIRLTAERWGHIAERHPELSGLSDLVMQAVAEPVRVLDGDAGSGWRAGKLNPTRCSWSSTRRAIPAASSSRRS